MSSITTCVHNDKIITIVTPEMRELSGSVVECLRHCVVSLSKNNNPSLVLVQPRKTRPFITERVLMGHKESNQTNKNKQTPEMMFQSNLMSYDK